MKIKCLFQSRSMSWKVNQNRSITSLGESYCMGFKHFPAWACTMDKNELFLVIFSNYVVVLLEAYRTTAFEAFDTAWFIATVFKMLKIWFGVQDWEIPTFLTAVSLTNITLFKLLIFYWADCTFQRFQCVSHDYQSIRMMIEWAYKEFIIRLWREPSWIFLQTRFLSPCPWLFSWDSLFLQKE